VPCPCSSAAAAALATPRRSISASMACLLATAAEERCCSQPGIHITSRVGGALWQQAACQHAAHLCHLGRAPESSLVPPAPAPQAHCCPASTTRLSHLVAGVRSALQDRAASSRAIKRTIASNRL
jgi:hypothetical protein